MKLTWSVTVVEPIPCPDYRPDPYTGQFQATHCAVYHCRTIQKQMEKEFSSKEEALEFKGLCKYVSVSDWKLDGEPI